MHLLIQYSLIRGVVKTDGEGKDKVVGIAQCYNLQGPLVCCNTLTSLLEVGKAVSKSGKVSEVCSLPARGEGELNP